MNCTIHFKAKFLQMLSEAEVEEQPHLRLRAWSIPWTEASPSGLLPASSAGRGFNQPTWVRGESVNFPSMENPLNNALINHTETAVAHSICMLHRSLTYQKMRIANGHLLTYDKPM